MPNTLPLGSNPFLKINPLCILSKLQSAQSYTAEELEDMSIQILKLQDHISLFEEVALQLRNEADDLPAEDEELREIYNDQITALSQTVEAMTGYAKVCRDEILKRKAAGAGVERKYLVSETELKTMANGVYYFDSLFKPQIQWASKEAFKQGRPDATRFYDVWHEPAWFIGTLKNILTRNGFTWRK